jgi:hypothetical protein
VPQSKVDKPYYSFSKGIITERSPLNFEDGSALDMSDFELRMDGSVKRRRGLDYETGGATVVLPTVTSVSRAFSSFKWTDAGGVGQTLIVEQVGQYIKFYKDNTTLSTQVLDDWIDLDTFATPSNANLARNESCTYAAGRGYLFIANPYCETIYVTYDPAVDGIHATAIPLSIRDFTGIDDGVLVNTQPASLTDDHTYNLLNRGWRQNDITGYFADKSKYPSKAMVPWMGYKRLADTGVDQEGFGIKQWSSDKMEAEVFGDSSAPQGRITMNAYDTTTATVPGVDATSIAITGWTLNSTTPPVLQFDTASPHGLTTGDLVTISGATLKFNRTAGHGGTTTTENIDGSYTATVIDADTIRITYHDSYPVIASLNSVINLGSILDEGSLPSTYDRSNGYSTDRRPSAVAFFAGRVFYAGIADQKLSDVLLFSPVVESVDQFGKCYQQNDPTGELFNALLYTDGGTIKVPGLFGVKAIVPVGNGLIVLAASGIWALTGGQNGFMPDQFNIRKISDVEALSPSGICLTDNGLVFTSLRGIYALGSDPNSGQLNAQSLTESTIQTLWNDIPDFRKAHVLCRYDDALRRVYWLYSTDPDTYLSVHALTNALILDLRLGAYFKYSFPYSLTNYIIGLAALETGDNAAVNNKMKFTIVTTGSAAIEIADLNHSDFLDWTATEQIPYIITAYDNMKDWQRQRQAPLLHTFMQKTETGFTAVGDDLVPVGESSLTVQARWNFADHANSGKYGSPQQVYRRTRQYMPTDVSDTFDDGTPVIITRNKLRGRGRSLHLYWLGAVGYDAHLLGWAIQYAVTRKE